MNRAEIYAQGKRNYRAVNAFIKNSLGQLLIPRRSEHKKIFPNGLDFSMSGCVSSGETYEQGLERESLEEAGVIIDWNTIKLVGSLNPHTDDSASFSRLYEIELDTVPTFNDADFSGWEWLYPHEILERISAEPETKTDLPIYLKKFYIS